VDAESLALDAEGLLSRRQSARVRSHLSGCPQCAAARQQLTEVTALLGQVPAAPLPPAIAARLDLALSAEAARRAAEPTAAGATWAANGGPATAPPATAPPADASPATAPPATPAGTHRSPAPPGRARRPAHGRDARDRTGTRRWGLRSPATLRLVSVAGAAVVLAAGGYGLSQLFSGSSGSTSTASGAAAPSTALPVYDSGLSYHPATLGRQAAAALARYQRREAQVIPATGGIQGGPAQGSTPATGGGQAVTGPATRHGTDSLVPLISPAEEGILRGCAGTIADGRAVKLVDQARYAGHSAIIIVLAAGGGRPATVWVMGPGCSAGHPDKITEGPLGG
jgi:hypothetical protein